VIGLAKLAAGAGHVELAERPQPAPAAGQVLIEVQAAGVCGTDLHIEAGEYPSSPPVTMGHEVAGVVAEAGAGVEDSWLGARVVTETFFSTCGRCPACRDGRPNLCPRRRSIGTHVDGGFAPLLVSPERNLHRVPDWLAAPAAALSEPLACVCQCMFDPPAVSPGDRVLVAGPGPMGLLAAQVAATMGGAVTVAGLPSDEERLQVARRLGFATLTQAPEAESVEVAIDASGSAGGIAACLTAARRGGRFVLIGISGAPVSVSLDSALFKELELATGFASTPRAWRRALALLERREVDLEVLVSEVAPLNEWGRVFAELRAGRLMKAVLDPRSGVSDPTDGWSGQGPGQPS
jgi:L-iditol 2-dehydrogenase